MSATNTIKVRCPSCRAKYRIAADATGKKLRCSKCSQVFRISSSAAVQPDAAERQHPAGVPTEDDICRWLMEGIDEDVPARPRIANAPQASPVLPERYRKAASVSVGRGEVASRKTPSVVNHPQETADQASVVTHDRKAESPSVRAHDDHGRPAGPALSLRKTA